MKLDLEHFDNSLCKRVNIVQTLFYNFNNQQFPKYENEILNSILI